MRWPFRDRCRHVWVAVPHSDELIYGPLRPEIWHVECCAFCGKKRSEPHPWTGGYDSESELFA